MADRAFSVIPGGNTKNTTNKKHATRTPKSYYRREVEIIVESVNTPSIASQVRAIALLLGLPLEPFADLLIETRSNMQRQRVA